MQYKRALAFLDTANFMNPDPGLESIEALLEELGNPHDDLRFVHIAGTNGKGSTAAMIERILREGGYRTGLYTSPYIDHFSEKIRIDGKEIDLSLREYELLKYLIDNKGIALSRDKILNNVWNYDYYGDSRTIDSHIKKIRHKLGKKGKHIQTIRGIGYKFEIK